MANILGLQFGHDGSVCLVKDGKLEACVATERITRKKKDQEFNDEVIDYNWERSDTFFAQIGTGMNQSNGIFTFPQTGIYLLMSQHHMNTSASYAGVKIRVSSNSGSDYSTISYGTMTNTNNGYHHLSLHAIDDVTNASNFRLKLEAENSGNVQYSGDSDALRNGITFIRLGDT